MARLAHLYDTKSGRLLASERQLTRTESPDTLPPPVLSRLERGLQIQAGECLRILLVAPRSPGR